MPSAAEMLAVYKKDYGDKVGGFGAVMEDVERVPTGCFELDLATGGGLPKGRVSIVYGPESSGKTNISFRAVHHHQMLWPKLSCIWMAIEPFDAVWARQMGVDTDKLILMKPDYAEQCVDMVEGFMGSDDCGLVVVDSIAAMVTTSTAAKSAEDAVMGGIGTVMSRFCDKIALELRKAEKEERPFPTILFVNQIRNKVGIVFGSPLAMPGGGKQKFLTSLTIRVTGKNIMDAKVSKVLPVSKEVQFVLEKWKVPVVAANGKFEMAMRAHNGLEIGECDDTNTILGILKTMGHMAKAEKTGYVLFGETFPTVTAIKEKFATDKVFSNHVRKKLIEIAVAAGGIPSEKEP
jgi:recombination protein RecA